MKLYCEREALLGDCQLASAAVASRDIKPILKNGANNSSLSPMSSIC